MYVFFQHMTFDRNILTSLGSGIDTMQSLLFYNCDTMHELKIQNVALDQPMLVENNINEAITEMRPHEDENYTSLQKVHVFNITNEGQQVEIQIIPLKPNRHQFQVFVSYQMKPTYEEHDWTGMLWMKAHSPGTHGTHSTFLPKEIGKRLGKYYVVVRESGESTYHNMNK